MSRALGQKDYATVKKSSAFGFYWALFSGILLSLVCLALNEPLLRLLGADPTTISTTKEYLTWNVICGAVPSILNVVLAYLVRAEGAALHASLGTMSGCLLNIILDPIFILPWGLCRRFRWFHCRLPSVLPKESCHLSAITIQPEIQSV